MDTLYATLAEILEVDNVKPNDILREFENWDSLTVLSIIATLDANFGVGLTSADLKGVTSAGELAALVVARGRK